MFPTAFTINFGFSALISVTDHVFYNAMTQVGNPFFYIFNAMAVDDLVTE